MISPIKIWRRQKKVAELSEKTGVVVTWTKIFVPGKDFKGNAPYFVVLVDFGDGEKAFGQLVDYNGEKVKTGLKVKAVIRRVREVQSEDVIPYGIKFVPVG